MVAFNVVLYDDFETLDACGPAEVIGQLPEEYRLGFFSREGGIVTSVHGLPVQTEPFAAMDATGVLLIPGGIGARQLVLQADYVAALKMLAEQAKYVLTVCTGAVLLAKTGLLEGRAATSNKRAFDFALSMPGVDWQKQARWVDDGKFYTSSGISAGIDMALGFVSNRLGWERAVEVAQTIEYIWNFNKEMDPFGLGLEE